MIASDGMVVGQPLVDEAFFSENTFYDQFNSLDIRTDGSVGATGSVGNGVWKEGFYAHNTSTYGMDWANDGVINFERQKYSSPDQPHPDGRSPFRIEGGNLVVDSWLIDQSNSAEVEWAKNKTYHLNPDGSLATLSDFPSGVPSELGSYTEEGGSGGPLLFWAYPMKYGSGMLSTYGSLDFSIFGRYQCRAKMPYGADGSSADIMQRSAIFPAPFWLLQSIPYGRGVNGEATADPSTTTYMPFTNSGAVTEFDVAEAFGEHMRRVHQTIHFHEHTDIDQIAYQHDTGKDVSQNFIEYTMDITPEFIAFAVDGIYTQVVPTPIEVSSPLSIYQTVPDEPYNVVRDSNGWGVRTGEVQKNTDGSDKYMRGSLIMNLARDGKYPRDLALSEVNNGLPPHTDSCEMTIDYVRVARLLDSPDTFESDGLTPGTDDDTAVSFTGETFQLRQFVGAVGEPGTRVPCRVDILSNPLSQPVSYSWRHENGGSSTFDDSTAARTELLIAADLDQRTMEVFCDVEAGEPTLVAPTITINSVEGDFSLYVEPTTAPTISIDSVEGDFEL